ncbi:MAG: cation-translocating P-type ATPase [Candidatus Moraniibacteriota bacterium]|nr:MAG: cation-translocating P-type ATPase [Candidatus Moranbacteria bacterium]
MIEKFFGSPWYAGGSIIISSLFLGIDIFFPFPMSSFLLGTAVVIGGAPVFLLGIRSLFQWHLSIEVFNAFAIIFAFSIGEFRSACFIVLMLAFASILEWRTERRSSRSIEELLALRPRIAFRERQGKIQEISVNEVQKDDILLVHTGERIPVDGVVIFGFGSINESSVTGESKLVEKIVGDFVLGSTLNEGNPLRIRATRVGKDSTLERMIALVLEAGKNKSKPERLADRFAGIFLPFVLLLGAIAFWITKDASVTAAIFLVACADDIAVAIPLAVTATIGYVAKNGVIVKGGGRLSLLAQVKTIVFDKTGTLTFGSLELRDIHIEPWIPQKEFWKYLAIAEKFSDHPVGRAAFRRANREYGEDVPDSDAVEVLKGVGITVSVEGKKISIGKNILFEPFLSKDLRTALLDTYGQDWLYSADAVVIDEKIAGFFVVEDIPRLESKESLERLRSLGIEHLVMLTGDDEKTARKIASELGITEVLADMTPELKLRVIEKFSKNSITAMIGDGVNDAPSLARADIGIAMGGGTASAIETADIVILSDNLSHLGDAIEVARRMRSVIFFDMGIWFVTNMIGIILVFMGVFGPALAAFYNFFTDFLPVINSLRLFWKKT